MPTIVLTGGGSGGHITPLLSLAHALKEKSPRCQIVYIGWRGEKLESLQKRYGVFDRIYAVPAGKFRRYHGQSFLAHLADVKTLVLNGRDFFRVIRGVFAARKLLKQIKPDVVFSKGSFVAVPVGVAAHYLGYPIITHDSDAVPGLANRILGRWAAVHAVGQPEDNYSYAKNSVRYTGIPTDERVQPVTTAQQKVFKTKLGLPDDSLVMLVVGGGLGSQRLNDLVITLAAELLAKFPNLRIINITGEQNQASVQADYQKIPEAKLRVQVLGLTADFYQYSGAADLILTRAGATALAEFAIQSKACIVIPHPGSGDHQLINTKQLRALGAAKVASNEIEPKKLFKIITTLLQNQQARQELGAKLSTLARPQAASELADIILDTASAEADS